VSLAAPDRSWVRPALAAVLVLVALSPAFAWGAEAVGYAEPLENAAEETGAADDARVLVPGLLPDYSVPGLGLIPGTILSGLVGSAVTLLLAVGVGRYLAR
jgi:cobalt/nickel transport protein